MKNMVTKLVLVLVVLLGVSGAAWAGPGDDYKVIKKAKDGKAVSSEEVQWFKIEVRDMETDKLKVKVTIPISLIEIVSEWVPEGKVKVDNDMSIDMKDIDLRKVLQELKKVGPMAFVEVYEDNEHVKIWVE